MRTISGMLHVDSKREAFMFYLSRFLVEAVGETGESSTVRPALSRNCWCGGGIKNIFVGRLGTSPLTVCMNSSDLAAQHPYTALPCHISRITNGSFLAYSMK